ncbi:CLUMA_CG011921, isoform A [Clunio marinus]|uniref:CLUMA_CG011921, isoform A n=1 Tax=Clunio marinus TaxID=568069 RepID=A0A1J1IH38_9DIPT|nr:CLUMA_CG011921, isoform A [Clunio marinus]
MFTKKMAKRSLNEFEEEINDSKRFLSDIQGEKKHTLDSDESDNEEDPQMNPDDIEGEEAGDERVDADEEIKFTPFNMKEELEEGHFDQMGHYHFKKGDERHLDNWLDDVDWVKVKKDENYRKKYYTADGEYNSSSDEDDDLAGPQKKFNSLNSFKEILTFMQPNESINRTLQRLNKSKLKVSTAQMWKMKKQGIVDEASNKITKITGLVNEILTQTGNMNVYELTYEQIEIKVKAMDDKSEAGPSKEVELDMYADDFDEKEKDTLKEPAEKSVTFAEENRDEDTTPKLMWEYKITQNETDPIFGPFTTEQMSKKADNGEFKENVYVRKVGDERFYSSARIDFDLYL